MDEDLTLLVTEIEKAELAQLIPILKASKNADKMAGILRRLLFQHDELKGRLAEILKNERLVARGTIPDQRGDGADNAGMGRQ